MNDTEKTCERVTYRLSAVELVPHRLDTGCHWPHERAG